MKTAFITGISGQDGTYLALLLQKQGYCVVGIDKYPFRYAISGIEVNTEISLTNYEALARYLKYVQPDEIYHLATYHHAAETLPTNDDRLLYLQSHEIHVGVTDFFLEWILKKKPTAQLFYAASCHIYGKLEQTIQDEQTPYNPNCIYGITKYAGLKLCEFYRSKYHIFAAVGILYHHESPLRPEHFVSKKIVQAAVAIRKNKLDKLILGDLNTVIDWGYAPEYVAAMYIMLQHQQAETMIIATGRGHTIKDFVEVAFARLGLDWRLHVLEDKSLLKKQDKGTYIGNNTKIKKLMDWEPTTSFSNLVHIMVDAELEQYE